MKNLILCHEVLFSSSFTNRINIIMLQEKEIKEPICKCQEPLYNISIFSLIIVQLFLILVIEYNQVEQQKLQLFDNWKKTAIIEFNISDQCKSNDVNINFTIPKINYQCSCQEGYYDQICKSDQIQIQDCIDIDEYSSQIITKWVFTLMDSQIGLKMCSQPSNIKSYYQQLQNNQCFNDQELQTSPISNIKIVRKYYQIKQKLLSDSIILDRDINDPIIDIKIIYQNELDNYFLKNKYSILDSYQVKQIWDVNGIYFKDQQNHPHIYNQINYTLVTQKYIKLNQNCNCSNKIFGLFDQLDQTVFYIRLIFFIQIGMTAVVLLSSFVCQKHVFFQLFLQLLLSGSYVYLRIFHLNPYDENMQNLNICFDNYQINSNLNQDMKWYLYSIYALNSIHLIYLFYRTISQCRQRPQRQQKLQHQSNSTIQSNAQKNNLNYENVSNDNQVNGINNYIQMNKWNQQYPNRSSNHTKIELLILFIQIC
ncbi:hypothetical protein pb186bvf_010910 [Paramecium bursaria]